MKVVLQRVKSASVTVNSHIVGEIDAGYLLLVGIGPEDDENAIIKAAHKIANLRIFEDSEGKMNLDLAQTGGSILAVSQFTLYADCRKGNRPSFTGAASPDIAEEIFDRFVSHLRELGIRVETGVFGAVMDIELVNHGPVTMLLEF